MTTDIEARAREMWRKGNPWGAIEMLIQEIRRLRELLAAKEKGGTN